MTDIDTSGIHALEDLYKSLQKRDIQVNIYKQIDLKDYLKKINYLFWRVIKFDSVFVFITVGSCEPWTVGDWQATLVTLC